MAEWIVYKEYDDCVLYYTGADMQGYNMFSTNKESAEQMTLARARRMAIALGGKYRKN